MAADAASLCLKSGNACILRGGSEAIESNRVIAAGIARGLAAAGLPESVVQLVNTTDRDAVGELLKEVGGDAEVEEVDDDAGEGEQLERILPRADARCSVIRGDAAGDGLQIEAKTFFFLPQGTVVNHGCTSVRPFFSGVGDTGATHITGSIGPAEFGAEPNADMPLVCQDAGGIVYTDRGFTNHGGSARLSGAVNLTNAGAGEITFSCVFVLDLAPNN